MHVTEGSGGLSVIIERGERLVAQLTELARVRALHGAALRGLGAIKDVELGYYDLERRDYLRTRIDHDVELLSLVGNVSLKDGAPYVHVHAAVADTDFVARGGHLFEAVVAVTAEIWIDPLGAALVRRLDPSLGLATICPPA